MKSRGGLERGSRETLRVSVRDVSDLGFRVLEPVAIDTEEQL